MQHSGISSWRDRERIQMPVYTDNDALNAVETQLRAMPPLVFADEARRLKRDMAAVSRGEAFLLQGGDCAESFEQFGADMVRDTFKVLLQMAMVLTYGAKVPVVKVGRIAGQFAKPRSAPTETSNGVELPSYRGDIINGFDFDEDSRIPDPERMIEGYTQAAATMNMLRGMAKGGLADINKVHEWTLGFTAEDKAADYRDIANALQDTMDFIRAAGLSPAKAEELASVDFYTSHEGLLLEYEESLTRRDPVTGEYVAGSGHLIWIGDRTRQPDGAHVEFCRQIINPIGLKCGPTTTAEDLKVLVDRLMNGKLDDAGRLMLITRFGAGKVEEHLPRLIETVEEMGAKVVWTCDPMHGNTIKSGSGYKTRPFEDVLSEVQEFFDVHQRMGTVAGGVHFEMTGQDVTECTGGVIAVTDEDLSDRYHTACDPRLNASQSLELAFLVNKLMREKGGDTRAAVNS
ncbi:class II 3-deoxy-7-phosphoheptulonate synthase [Palleronia caenipelagi]|uniref:Phospho-2-dehydro-3-deoxyheptonate aldolase n=1 Tax=Palleronia caenipelagi TaxID=2489174 RepID=A0A547Q613_9RHOB|nr:3-deoxy-7-phosphoheptulonate synthase class II [Palleronia caenipelagi]TRD21812.1 3-deoxy-7-phosphoheptulonate synthase class II [Palleronia caenipelagi]